MKSSLIASGLVVATLFQGLAHAQVFDLPEPGGVPAAKESAVPPFDMAASQYAGSLRLGPISRKEDGSHFRIILAQAARLLRLDLRVTFGKARVRQAWLVTESGVKIEVLKYQATGVLDSSLVTSSENFSLNENISEILVSAEAFTDDAELFITALSETVLPKLTLWQPPMNTTPGYKPEPGTGGPVIIRGGECVNNFCVGDVAIYMRQRGKIVQVRSDGRVVLVQRGVRKTVSTSQLMKPSLPPYR